MDRKKTQRIIGILVIIALVIIALPLFVNTKNEVMETTYSSNITPPNPQPLSPDTVTATPPVLAEAEPALAPSANETNNLPPQQPTPPITDNTTLADKTQPSEVPIQPQQQPILSNDPMAASQAQNGMNLGDSTQDIPTPITHPIADRPTPKVIKSTEKAPVLPIISHKKNVKVVSHVNPQSPKHAGWAIQMGSFAQKNNAVRLFNQLKMAGYTVFTREVKVGNGFQTRVYIGPESKQSSAVQLSSEVKLRMKMHGFVVPYITIAV